MFPTLQIGPLAIQTPGLVLLIGLWLGLSLAEKRSNRYRVDPTDLYNMVFFGLIAGLIGARLSYAAQYLESFIEQPLSLLSLNPTLLDPLGGLLIGLLVALIYGNRKQLAFWSSLDALTPLLAVMALAVGISQLAAGDAFGRPTSLPWGIELWGARRHPTQIYQSSLSALILWYVIRPTPADRIPVPGKLFLQFVSLTSIATIFTEAFRGDSLLLDNGLRTVQLAAWVILAGSLWLLNKRRAPQQQTTHTPRLEMEH